MTVVAPPAGYTLKRVREMLGLSHAVLTGLIASGVITPTRGPRNQRRFSFQDMTLLRTARGLEQAGIRPGKILHALERLREQLPSEQPLTGLRLRAVGRDVAVRDANGRLRSPSGQWLMAFDAEPPAAMVRALARPTVLQSAVPESPPLPVATDGLARAQAFDAAGSTAQAEAAYREAMASDPADCRACLNLGALLCEADRCSEAAALIGQVLRGHPDHPLLHFNLAVALEGSGDTPGAVASYQRALALDADLADAHYNLAALLQCRGDLRGALRHLNAYRRLHANG